MLNSIVLHSPEISYVSIFGFELYFYGIVLALAIIIGLVAAHELYKRFYGNDGLYFIYDYSPYLILSGILGARLYYCLVNYSYYVQYPLEIFNIRQGGLSIHGMIIVGIVTLCLLAKHKKLSFLKLADVYCCASLLAQSIGRWGNFFNNEAFGYPTDGFVKLFIPTSQRPLEFVNIEYFHPTFLYESVLDFIGFLILLLLFKRFSKKSGLVACSYLILYSVIRIFTESLRLDSVLNISGISIAIIVSVITLIFGLVCSFWLIKK